jgi:ABC-type nitrate/sulfonate/bicarbonate transport system permease component
MAAISELGIAQQFVMILFAGFVVAVSLAAGLAFGLGSKSTVERMMLEWYDRMRREE